MPGRADSAGELATPLQNVELLLTAFRLVVHQICPLSAENPPMTAQHIEGGFSLKVCRVTPQWDSLIQSIKMRLGLLATVVGLRNKKEHQYSTKNVYAKLQIFRLIQTDSDGFRPFPCRRLKITENNGISPKQSFF